MHRWENREREPCAPAGSPAGAFLPSGQCVPARFVWSIPPEVLAERMSVSVDAIQRSCTNRGIPYPGAGYWMQVAAGMRPPRPPLTEHRPGPQGTTGTAEDAIDTGEAEGEDPVEAFLFAIF